MSNPKNKLDTGLVRELAAILREADLGEVEIEHDGLRIRVSKPAAPVSAPMQAYATPQMMAAPASPAASAPPAATAAPAISENAVKSPMVGTAYLSPEPGAKAFINVGDKVKKGDTLLLIEAMKTFNPVDAPRAGTITAIIIDDAQPVEYGEPLVVID